MNINITEFLSTTIGSFVLFVAALTFFVRVQKDIRIKKWIIYAVGIPFNIIVSALYVNEIIPKSIISSATNLFLICVALLLSKDKIASKIVNLIIYYIIASAFDLLSYMLFANITSVPYWIVSLIMAFTIAFVLLFAEQFIKTFRDKKIEKKSLLFLLIPLSQLVAFGAVGIEVNYVFPRHDTLLEQGDKFSGTAAIIVCISTLLSFVVDIIVFRQYVKSLDMAQIEAENKTLEYKNKLNTDYFNELKENETELRKIKHDISGCLETMKEILYSENDVEKAQGFFDEISHTLENITTGFYCKNSLINAIIISKSKICSKNNINLNVDIKIPEQLNIPDMDICRAIVNMLDNAIEANEKISGKKFINLSIQEKDGYIYIHIDNPHSGEPIGNTSKTDKKEHGYGLKILNDFASKYDGYFNVETDNDIASSLMVMKNATV